MVKVIEIDIMSVDTGRGSVCIYALDSKVKLWQFREVGQVNAGIDRGSSRSANRGNVVRRERIRVEGQPVPEKWNAIGEAEARSAFPGARIGRVEIGLAKAEVAVKNRGWCDSATD